MLFIAWILALILRTGTALAMTFTPTVTDLSVVQGESFEADFTVQNSSDASREYLVSLYDVVLSQSLESPTFAPLPQEKSEWLSLDAYGFSLASGESRVLLLRAAPPSTASDDSFVVGLVVREIAEDNANAVSSGVTSLIFVTVGDPTTDATVTRWDVSPAMTSRLSIDVTAEIKNSGSRVVQPYGMLRVVNTFGGVVKEVNINPTLNRIPEGDTRTFTAAIRPETSGGFFYELWREVVEHRVGIFTARLVAAPYPGADATLAATARFVVFPWRTAFVLLGLWGAVRIARRNR